MALVKFYLKVTSAVIYRKLFLFSFPVYFVLGRSINKGFETTRGRFILLIVTCRKDEIKRYTAVIQQRRLF